MASAPPLSVGNTYDGFHAEGNARVIAGNITIIFAPSARELLERLPGSIVGDTIHNALRVSGSEDVALARVDFLDTVQSSNTRDITQSWEKNQQALQVLRQYLETLDPLLRTNMSLRQDFLKLESRLRANFLQGHEGSVLLVQHSPQPTYSLCYGFPEHAIEALKETTEQGYHHGLFWDVREPLQALHSADDIHKKKYSITIQFLSVDKDVGCWKMLQAWQKQLTKEHKNIEQRPDEKNMTLALDQLCVLDKLQDSFCGVHVTLKVIPSGKYYKIQGITDKKQKTFSVLCFSLLDLEKFEQTCREWLKMRDFTMRKAPDAFLGISQERGEIRQFVTTARSSIQTVPRETGRLAANAFRQDEDKVATRLYIEIAQGNDSARATFFPTLIGCAVAYTCFELPTEEQSNI